MDSEKIAVEFRSLSVGYNSVPLHEPFSFRFREGEFAALIGANGSGKSTILKTLIREIPAVSGDVLLYRRNILDFSEKALACEMSALLTVGVRSELLTCRDVVASGRYPHTGHFGLLSGEDNAKIDEVISLVKAEDFAQKDFMTVSDGQKQRILFARALCQNPKVLVLDEPTSYLDIRWRFELLSLLKDLCKGGMTVIASIHEIDLALEFSDRILCVGEGDVRELSGSEERCKSQILSLYGLGDDFFKKQPFYSDLVKQFCAKNQKNCESQSDEAKKLPKSEKNASAGKSIMIQGTMSSAGKSFVVAGLCRIFRQDGFSVAPFKSQNMALNSFVTSEGLEMGRAQVMQAEAAGIEPSVRMNPILLKPTSDVGSQVIVNGEVLGNMAAKEYFSFKKSLVPKIWAAYEALSREHEIVVIEGAGSPAEINLKENDIVNMGMANISDSPVLLVADIDRGGVFAQLLGTVALLTEEERARVKGFIINKFRGDKSILDSGIKMIEERTGIPVVGTIPYMRICLDDEDSLSENLRRESKFREKSDEIQICVIKLPHISNFTDFNPFLQDSCVNLYYAEKPKDLGFPDCILIPGTKNTLFDVRWLKESGFADLIRREAKKGTEIAGICGGFQILGEKITGSETDSDSEHFFENGLSLLPVETVFQNEKTRTRVFGKTALHNLAISGYEIHMGQTRFVDGAKESYFSKITDSVSGESKMDGAVRENVFGTYIHGVFDEAEFRRKFMEAIASKKGKKPIFAENARTAREFKENEYNRLADTLREHLDMKKVYEILLT